MVRLVIQGLRPPPGSLRISVKTKVRNGREDNELHTAFTRFFAANPVFARFSLNRDTSAGPLVPMRSQTSNTHHLAHRTTSANL
jgi:hypothetical protein